MSVNIALPSSAYFDFTDCCEIIDAGVKRMKAHGFDSVDYQGFAYHEIFNWSEDEFLKRLGTTAHVCQKNGVHIFQSHGPSRWPAKDATDEDRAEIFEKMSKSIRGSALLECKYLVLHTIMPFGTGKISDEEIRLTREINLDYFCKLESVAKAHGVVICLENLPFKDFSLSQTSDVVSLVKEINSPYVRICLDTGHSAIFGAPEDDIRLAGEYLATVHLHDNNGRRDEHKMPFEGKIDWQEVCRALCDVGFDGALNFETWAQGHYPPHIREYMEKGFAMTVRYVADMYSDIRNGLK